MKALLKKKHVSTLSKVISLFSFAVIGLATFMWLIGVDRVQAFSCTVPTTSYPTIQVAVDDIGCDVILLTDPFYSERVTIDGRIVTIQGQEIARAIVDGNNEGTVFTIEANAVVTLTNLTIMHGNSGDSGGGILNFGTLTIISSTVSYNHANGNGGGIVNSDGTLNLRHSDIISNSTNQNGGGIFNSGVMVAEHDLFRDNWTTLGAGGALINTGILQIHQNVIEQNMSSGSGGGIRNIGTLTMTESIVRENNTETHGGGLAAYQGHLTPNYTTIHNSEIYSNSAEFAGGGLHNENGSLDIAYSTIHNNRNGSGNGGGGIGNDGGTILITYSTLHNNVGDGGGGAINNVESGEGPGFVTVMNSTFHNNSATYRGGAVFNNGSHLTLVNSTLSHNHAGDVGGAIFSRLFPSSITVTNSTIVSHTSDGGAIHNETEAHVTLYNTIVANNDSQGNCVGSNFDALGMNLASDSSCGASITAVPHLGELQDNGGATWTHALLPGSLAIDAGDNAICLATPVNGIDQRGYARPIGPNCDLGAFEQSVTAIYLPLIQK